MANAAGSSSSTLCSICWEEVSDGCIRTVVKLQCSHLFHLDCIGSAFNVSGVMRCPNCREIEHGVWRRFQNNTEEIGDEDSEEEEERNRGNMIGHHCPGNNWCPRHGWFAGVSHPGYQDLTQLSPPSTGDRHLYSPSMFTNISSPRIVFPGHNLVQPAVLAPQCDVGGLPNFEPAGHGAILPPGRRSNDFPVWLPPPDPVQNISLPPQQIVCHVPPLNLTIQNNLQANNPRAANQDPVDHSLSLSIQNHPTEPIFANDQYQERFETKQLLPDDMGPFRAPRN